MESNTKEPVPVMDFDPVPFDEATAMFNDEEKYKYIRCIKHYWYHTHVSGLPNDDEGLRQLCQCPLEKWRRLKGMIFDGDKFFFLENGKWHQKRARANYQKKLEILKANQRKTQSARKAALSVRDSVTKSITEEIYEAYPLKVGKPAALRAIKKAMARTSPERLLELTRAYAKRRNGDKYCMPHPATWFNQERYNDDPSTWVQAEEGKPIAERIGPALAEVQAVVLEKCGKTPENQAFSAHWHLFWSGKKWLKQGRPMDWQNELAIELAKKGMSK